MRSNIKESFDWKEDLKGTFSANWGELVLKTEEMAYGRWWWIVYDPLDNDMTVADSTEYEISWTTCDKAKSATEKVAFNYLKYELLYRFQLATQESEIFSFIEKLKICGASLNETIDCIINKLSMETEEVKKLIHKSGVWS